jgi:hypothetical protein
MSQLGVFTALGPSKFRRTVVGENPDLSDCRSDSIDGWRSLHAVLQSKGPPLSLAVAGDLRHPNGGHSLDDFVQGSHDYYVALMTPRLVREIAKALSIVTAKKFRQWESELGVDPGNSAEPWLRELKAVYRAAAAEKKALLIAIA